MGKTLKELNVRPGDVVRHEDGELHPIKMVNGRLCATSYESEWSLPVESSTMQFWSIVSRATPEIDLTAITTPLGLLDNATRDALKAHGGPYRYWDYDAAKWYDEKSGPVWYDGYIISVKPSPKVETVVRLVHIEAGIAKHLWVDAEMSDPTHKLTLTIQGDDIIGVTTEKLE